MKSIEHQQVVLPPTESAAVVMFDSASRQHPIISIGSVGTLFSIAPAGAVYSIKLEIPSVCGRDPVLTVDSDWQPFMQDGEQVSLSNNNNAQSIPAGTPIRATKPSTVGYSVGLVWILFPLPAFPRLEDFRRKLING